MGNFVMVRRSSTSMKKFRLKIEFTTQYQGAYTGQKFGQKQIDKLEKHVTREIWTDTGKIEGVWPILSYYGKEFVWMFPWMLEELRSGS